ncbi:DgyrCDS8925 [Dimorphilus gyrociliatus]|uniref:Ubiquitin carboxyl-terminal hydrolase n=1 Tax=Dimorphilus gyrociliatus TaxID=2664684 RepID=A0A7I8VVI2_9ANNE|nr:DgyrCDS8925 [Dimorphilus gyrociliatus]
MSSTFFDVSNFQIVLTANIVLTQLAMRVCDKNNLPNIKSKMPKKSKKKQHRKRSDRKEAVDESSDDGRSGRCLHFNKATNINSMKKALKQQRVIGRCSGCMKESAASGGADSEDDVIVWICLQCGYQGCGRNTKDRHSLKHFETPRSNSHSLVCNSSTMELWCYECDDYIPPPGNRFDDFLEVIKKFIDQSTPSRMNSHKSDSSEDNNFNSKCATGSSQPSQLNHKIKGLSNLGNTCFFNAVMQSLNQTPGLDTLIVEHAKSTAMMTLPGCNQVSDSEGSSGDEEKDIARSAESIKLELGECGNLTQALASFLRDMQHQKGHVLTPNILFGNVCKKAPKFKGYQQQDSHELLRYLWDGVKAEEIKRVQSAVCLKLNIGEKKKSGQLTPNMKSLVKYYGRQARHTIVDNIFGGLFISTVTCEECQTPSQIFEPFLDISLPITEDKLSGSFKSKRGERRAKAQAAAKLPANVAPAASEDSDQCSDADVEDNLSTNANSVIDDNVAIDKEKGDNSAAHIGSVESLAEEIGQLKVNGAEFNGVAEKELKRKHYIVEKAMRSLGAPYHSQQNECSVQSCFSNFTAPEVLTGNNKFNCRYCSKTSENSQVVLRNASKRVLIFIPPSVLTIHLKRFQQIDYVTRKVNRMVQFPFVLDISPYCSSQALNINSNRVLYNLYAVVEHSGRISGGHYTAYVKVRSSRSIKNFLNSIEQNSIRLSKINELKQMFCNDDQEVDGNPGRWFYISDSRVSEVNEDAVAKCQAYLLFYERVL